MSHMPRGETRQLVHDAAAIGFDRSADAYERGRPDYPRDAVGWLTERVRLGRGGTIVDLAAGTGKLTRMLTSSGAEVVAVEPIHAMCAALRRLVPGVPVVQAVAEQIPLRSRSADVVCVAQRFIGSTAPRLSHRSIECFAPTVSSRWSGTAAISTR